MARKAQRSAKRPPAEPGASAERRSRTAPAPLRAAGPNWPLLALSVAGMVLAGYLTYTGWSGDRAAYCEAGGGCDIVQSSQWATFLGVPTAFWGLLLYATLTYVAVRVRRPVPRWQRAWVAAALGWGVSVYLTVISVFVLNATCPYCLASLGLFTAIVGLLVWQRPDGIPRFAWSKWLLQTGAVAAIAIVALHAQSASRTPIGPEDPYQRGLAERLSDAGAVFYGASWCPHCQQQKAMFGASQVRLPYVECSPGGPRAPSAPACNNAGIQTYPTWVFSNGERVSSVLSLADLASRVGYQPAAAQGSVN
jgi:uncharacterized membrane protein